MKRNRKGFTLIELLIVVVIVGILALAAIPLITSNTRDARRAEGTQLMQSARDYARIEYSKVGAWNATTEAAFTTEHGTDQWKGNYYSVDGAVANTTATGGDITSTAVNTSDGDGTLTFEWASGNSSIAWS